MIGSIVSVMVRSTLRQRSVLAVIGITSMIMMVLGGVASGPAAAEEGGGDHINGCVGTGTNGLFSSHSNEQQCIIGFYVCVGGDTSSYPARDGLPAGAVGVIMIPWGEDWHLTGGNYGYVGNVCNGSAGIANVITYATPTLWDSFPLSTDPSFASHMRLVQQQCAGQCRAELYTYYVGLQLWSDNSLHIREQGWQASSFDHRSLAYRLISFYLSTGPIYWDGYTVNSYGSGTALGTAGYGIQMSQTALAEDGPGSWAEFNHGMAQKAPEGVLETLKVIAEVIFIALW